MLPTQAEALPSGPVVVAKSTGRHGHPVVGDGEIEFDAESRPGAAIGDARELDRRIRVEHLLTVALVRAAVQVSAQVGQHEALQVFVLQPKRPPRLVHPAVGQMVAQGIRVVEAARSEQVEGGIRIGQAFFVGRYDHGVLPDPCAFELGGRLGRGRLRPRGARARRREQCQAPEHELVRASSGHVMFLWFTAPSWTNRMPRFGAEQ